MALTNWAESFGARSCTESFILSLFLNYRVIESGISRRSFAVSKTTADIQTGRAFHISPQGLICRGGEGTAPPPSGVHCMERASIALKICLTKHFLLFEWRLAKLLLLARVDFLKRFNWFVSSRENTQNVLVKYHG
jgi:hypothetical protein